MRDEVRLFEAYSLNEVRDRRELFGKVIDGDLTESLDDICYWIFYPWMATR
jgi:hypothetical protein